MTEDETSIVQGVILAVAFLFLHSGELPLRRYEKRQAYVISMVSWAVVMLVIFLVQDTKIPVYILGALAGFGVSAAHVIPSAMTLM